MMSGAYWCILSYQIQYLDLYKASAQRTDALKILIKPIGNIINNPITYYQSRQGPGGRGVGCLW